MNRASHVILAVLLAALFAASVQSCIARRSEFDMVPMQRGIAMPQKIRVLLSTAQTCIVQVHGGYEIKAGREVLFTDTAAMPDAVVTAFPGGMTVNTESIRHVQVDIIPKTDRTLFVNHKPYHGSLRLVNRPDRGLMAINVVELEDYLEGVITGEMPSLWPMAALKAQAIAARTYALYRARGRSGWDYDVAAGTGDQVYAGISGATASSRAAASQTRGVILLYDWKILPAYYHSVCGGHTAGNKIIFDGEDITPLAGIECPWCDPKMQGLSGVKLEKYHRWQVKVTHFDLLAALAKEGIKLQSIESIVPLRPDAGGHAGEVDIRPGPGTPRAPSVRVTADKFRSLIGYSKLISPSFTCTKEGDTFVINGRGYGHGVGMCQWGARGMAAAGYSAKAILEFYYPGADIVKAY